MKKVLIKKISSVVLHKEDSPIDGSYLKSELFHLDEEKFLPVLKDGEEVGVAKVYSKDNILFSNLLLHKDISENMGCSVGWSGTPEVENGEIKSMNITSISLIEKQADKGVLNTTLKEYDDINKGRIEVGKLIKSLQGKGWSNRRIKRHLFTKYKIILG